MVEISIIVPVYNAAAYLQNCIQSISNQTFKSIEIIVVNDGSTDNSVEIIKSLQIKDARIKLLDGPNKGVSYARNLGLKTAKGEYVGFVDADDWIEPNMFEKLHKLMQNENADLSICNILVHETNGDSKVRLRLKNDLLEINQNGNDVFQMMMDFEFDYANWNKLYRKSIIEKYQICFRIGMLIWEDLLFNLEYVQHTNRVLVTDSVFYHYRVHTQSVMQQTSINKIFQFNMLYVAFNEGCIFSSWKSVFKIKIAKSLYNAIIPSIANQLKTQSSNFTIRYKRLKDALKSCDPQMFYYPESNWISLQGVKKKMLIHGWYGLFAFVVVVKTIFK